LGQEGVGHELAVGSTARCTDSRRCQVAQDGLTNL
jgi:hypothetical protein